MFRHVVMWNFKDGLTAEEKKTTGAKVKAGLEGLKQHIPGVVEIKVIVNEHPKSNKEIMLDSTFEDENAFNAYKVHPEHEKVAVLTREVLQDRACVDYVE